MSDVKNEAWQYTTRGRLSTTIQLTQRPYPTYGEEDIVVEIRAAAVNPVEEQIAQLPDLMLRLGGAPPMGTPFIPSQDFSGVVHAAGLKSPWKVGDEVCGLKLDLSGEGTLQRYLRVPPSIPVIRKPSSLSFTEAAAMPLVYQTVYTALVSYGRLPFEPSPEDTGKRSVLILGGSSGTGSVAVMMAKQMGCKVVASCSGKNADFVKSLGADEIIDYRTEHVAEKAIASEHAPYAVVFDCVGGKDLIPYLNRLVLSDPKAPKLGIFVTIVGDKTDPDVLGGSVSNLTYPSQVLRHIRGALTDLLPNWLPCKSWIAGKRYACISLDQKTSYLDTIPVFLQRGGKVIIDSTFPFAEAKEAFAKLESSRAVGKVVVEFA
ncbi:hypothetical protein BCR39DRAFT_530449 [Naematelia encephala]|uniref:Enoyl reductase (ER) domain-containing protein n=1 Tax=Naematelia encephala TaxID=71784 RepID=A0A1Y2B5H8_9TREE|nr:hypothetical protein BCR39DRAFT_530449 [Naematelia encephala]